MTDYRVLEKRFGATLRRNEPLARYTAARLGGPADALIVAKTLRDLRVAEVKEMDARVDEGKIVLYRVKLKLSFKYETTEEHE